MSATERSTPTRNTRITAGDRIAFKDPDAGNHADGCPFESEIWYIGEVKEIRYNSTEDRTTIHFVGGPGPVDAGDDCLYTGDEIPDSIVRAFENSEYSTYMWETRHNPYHHLHDELGDKCDWGDEETVRTSGE